MDLLATNQLPQEILEYFNQLQMEDYVRVGNRVKEDVVIDEGPLDGFQHTMEPLLRSIGLMTTLKKGVIHLSKPFTICSSGDVLTTEQAKLLKLFQRPLAQFQIKVKAQWNRKSEQVRVFDIHDDDEDQNNEEEEEQPEEDNDED